MGKRTDARGGWGEDACAKTLRAPATLFAMLFNVDIQRFVMISQVGWVQKRYEHSTFARLPVDCRPGGQMCLESSMGIFFPSQLPMLLVGLT